MIRLPLEEYRPNGAFRPTQLHIDIEPMDEGAGVLLSVEADAKETLDDRDLDRVLTPDEAEELAAMLVHHARAQRRRWRA